MNKISISEIVAKTEELKKGDKPGHPFRGNQHTRAKGRGGQLITPVGSRTGSGTGKKSGGSREEQIARQMNGGKPVRNVSVRRVTGKEMLAETRPDGTKKYAKRSEAREAMTSPNTPKAVKERLASAKPLDGGGKRVYSNTIFNGRGRNAEGADAHIFAERSGSKTTYRVELHTGGGKGAIYDQSDMFGGAKSPTFNSLKEAKAHLDNFGGGGAGPSATLSGRRGQPAGNEPVDWWGIQ